MKRAIIKLCLSILLLTACDPDAVPPSLQEIVHQNGLPWKVAGITIDGSPLVEATYANIRYVFEVSNTDFTYQGTGISNANITQNGFKPNYNSVTDQGTWSVKPGGILVFDEEDRVLKSQVTILEGATANRIVLEWLVPERFDKAAPQCQMVLIPE